MPMSTRSKESGEDSSSTTPIAQSGSPSTGMDGSVDVTPLFGENGSSGCQIDVASSNLPANRKCSCMCHDHRCCGGESFMGIMSSLIKELAAMKEAVVDNNSLRIEVAALREEVQKLRTSTCTPTGQSTSSTATSVINPRTSDSGPATRNSYSNACSSGVTTDTSTPREPTCDPVPVEPEWKDVERRKPRNPARTLANKTTTASREVAHKPGQSTVTSYYQHKPKAPASFRGAPRIKCRAIHLGNVHMGCSADSIVGWCEKKGPASHEVQCVRIPVLRTGVRTCRDPSRSNRQSPAGRLLASGGACTRVEIRLGQDSFSFSHIMNADTPLNPNAIPFHPRPHTPNLAPLSNSNNGLSLNLRVGFLNVCHLLNKKHEVEDFIRSQNIDIMILAETFLSSSTADSLLSIPNHALFRRDRPGHGGGLAAYVHNRFQAQVVGDHTNIELLLLEIRSHRNRILLGGVYRPPGTPVQFWQDLSKCAAHLLFQHVTVPTR
eukprot:scpid80208/ scgid4479/ 